MTLEVPITRRGSRTHDGSGNDASPLQRQSSGVTPDLDVDGNSTTESPRSWSLDDIEGEVMELVDDIAIASAEESMERVARSRLFGFVATWGSLVIEEALVSAIAPTGDAAVDSNDLSVLNNSRTLLGRSGFPLETLDPPKRCPLGESYQRRQVPIRTAKRNPYDSEGLHHAVKATTRSHAHPASVTSSRLTMKNKMRKKQHGAIDSHVELTGPQPGVPYSTAELPDSHKGRHHIVSPRKAIAIHHPADADTVNVQAQHSTAPPSVPHLDAAAGLQLHLDTEAASTRSLQSPPSIASSRQRPHPPRSAQNGRAVKTFCFGERDDEVKVEYAVPKSPPRRNSISTKSVLPNIASGRMAPRPSLPHPAFGSVNVGGGNDGHEDESLIGEDPLDQHFHVMPLSPGVKVRTGEESNDGPDLPLFASRMRRSTFVRMETCSLPPQASDRLGPRASTPIGRPMQVQQFGKGTFITETAWDFSAEDRNSIGDHDRSHDFSSEKGWSKVDAESSAEMTNSCSCGSSASLTLFRKQSKVQRPCRSCNNPSAQSKRTETMNFTNLVKQRAFHLKPPCLPTSSSPSKRAPGTSPRRVTSAPASSRTFTRGLVQLWTSKTDELTLLLLCQPSPDDIFFLAKRHPNI
ncbi:hypothetical protein PHYPSEUDO_015544 [Phytophthora pseudosyringae]|uniref:Uncharacterized protein n=1 Tax=Phytophthora pseudosyringae TaxID=221518 RepID=A0A8T1W3E6_9STRA|nr:hypothetical protein PHYPSEUDO_015544 [Phytophthora pseudosyringae]